MKNKLYLFTFTLSMLFLNLSNAQERSVSGVVTDADGLPIPGVSIILKGTSTGTETDFDGNFKINANTNQILVFSFIGLKKQELPATNTKMVVVLQEDTTIFNEVVIVGYGSQSKRRLTDNISKISSKDISEIPNPNFQNSLVAKAAGVQVTQTNGKVEGGFSVRIRGQASINAGSEPLYVLDGVIVNNSSESRNGAPINPLITLAASEIESVEILKDASSAAIYGARGSNGVVIITTKKGKAGKPQFSFNISNSISSPTKTLDWMSSREYVDYILNARENSGWPSEENVNNRFDRYSNGTDWRNAEIDTDWQSFIFRDGAVRDTDFSVSGGDDKTKYFFSTAFNETEGIIVGNNLDRFNSRFNVSSQVHERLNLGMNMSYARTNIDRIANDNAFVTPMQAIAQAPISPAFLSNGDPFSETLYPNFLLEDKYGFFNTQIRRLIGNLTAEIKIYDFLKFNSNFGYDNYQQQENQYRGRKTPFMSTDGYAYNSNVNTENFTFSNFFTFNKKYNTIHDLNIVVGNEIQKSTRRFSSVEGIRFPSDDFQNINSAAEISAGRGSIDEFAFQSLFSRISYSYDNKYLFKATLRRDGSSRFGQNSRFGTFPAISAGWVVSEESFIKKGKFLSFLKTRYSWGLTGNASIPNFAARELWSGAAYNQRPGIIATQPGNPNLTWEKSTQTDFGIEYGVLDNKIMMEFDFFNKTTNGLLFSLPLPNSTGFSDVFENVGKMETNGFEFLINTQNITKQDFSWTSSLNLTNIENRILELPNGNQDIVERQIIRRVGERLNSFYMVEFAGVDPNNGDALFYVNDGTPSRETTNNYNEANRVLAGRSDPNWYAGLTNTFTYKNIDFSFTFQGEWGASVYNNGGRFQSANGDWFDNQTRDQLNSWTTPGQITNIPQARLGDGNGTQHSTRYLERTDFIRLRNINIGYRFSKKFVESLGISSLRMYVSGINLLTFTNFSGYDPEVRDDTGGIGEVFYSAPQAKTVSFGINVNF